MKMNENYCNVCLSVDRELKRWKIKIFRQLGLQDSALVLCNWCKAAVIKMEFLVRLINESQATLSNDGSPNKLRQLPKYTTSRFKCELCVTGFVTVEAFEEHTWRHTEEAGPYICPICSLHFKSHLVLSQHKLSHRRRFRCIQCGHSSTRWANAVAHSAKCVDIPEVSVCEVCRKVFNDKYSLDVHKKVHTRARKYICDECSKGFSTKQHLIVHIRTHSGARPFACNECDKTFCTNSNLKAHASVHSASRSYLCVECDKRYKTEKSLRKHYKTSVAHTKSSQM
ncbi:unnamed protein product [Leptidea sinapis]|uniref:C2H2-type domain-containing protein n=1 Tax=Leptidea sinapis TaxID=189913 RepID=A0A5E4QKW3_9NEOP|nr:unnamed protein product [Leptidea sinapis]